MAVAAGLGLVAMPTSIIAVAPEVLGVAAMVVAPTAAAAVEVGSGATLIRTT